MDYEEEYKIAKEIVQSGQSDEDWDSLRNGKGDWPVDNRKQWKKFRKYTLDELKDEMKVWRNKGIYIAMLLLFSEANKKFISSGKQLH
jgi:hypothetical protein